MLLSGRDKRRFFRKLDALLVSSSSRHLVDLACSVEAAATTQTDSTLTPLTDSTTITIVGDRDLQRDARNRSQPPSHQNSPDSMGRNLAGVQAVAQGGQQHAGKRNTRSTRADACKAASKRQKGDAADSRSKQGLLHGRRVLLVPVGPDVSRRRLDAWRDMVCKLGGSVVSDGKGAKSRAATDRGSTVEWTSVDIVIASAQLEAQKARDHFGLVQFPPPGVKVFTPEWLVYLLREKRFPPRDVTLAWGMKKEEHAQGKAGDHTDHASTTEAKRSANNDASDDEEGSNPNNASNREIQRALPVHFDSKRVTEEKIKLQREKERLVQERTVAFYKNNPQFVSLDKRHGEDRTRREAFICQQSSCAYS